ncbi:hypothetical protein C8J57DRAFT_1243457 [Mycena rebaudengoi]|nr:hypothetical protein C8J57DRAFT_1243457 [Mycena rebaudengoi]
MKRTQIEHEQYYPAHRKATEQPGCYFRHRLAKQPQILLICLLSRLAAPRLCGSTVYSAVYPPAAHRLSAEELYGPRTLVLIARQLSDQFQLDTKSGLSEPFINCDGCGAARIFGGRLDGARERLETERSCAALSRFRYAVGHECAAIDIAMKVRTHRLMIGIQGGAAWDCNRGGAYRLRDIAIFLEISCYWCGRWVMGGLFQTKGAGDPVIASGRIPILMRRRRCDAYRRGAFANLTAPAERVSHTSDAPVLGLVDGEQNVGAKKMYVEDQDESGVVGRIQEDRRVISTVYRMLWRVMGRVVAIVGTKETCYVLGARFDDRKRQPDVVVRRSRSNPEESRQAQDVSMRVGWDNLESPRRRAKRGLSNGYPAAIRRTLLRTHRSS